MIKKYSISAILVVSMLFPAHGLATESLVPVEILDISARTNNDKTTTIIWLTNTATRGQVVFGEDAGNLAYYIIDNSGAAKYHEVTITTPRPETVYYYKIIASTDAGTAESFTRKIKTPKYGDDIPPQISNVRVAYITGTLAVIEWETDKQSTSVVQYDEYGGYARKVSSDKKVTSHRLVLTKLRPATRYLIRLYSVDGDKKQSSWQYREFTTLASDNIDREDLIISYLRPSGPSDSYLSARSVFAGFKTNRYAGGKIALKGAGVKSLTVNLDYGTSHFAVFNGLTPSSEYTLEIYMTDVFGKKAEVKNYAIKTLSGHTAVTGSAPVLVNNGNGVVVAGVEGSACSPAVLNYSGYYGAYYNPPKEIMHKKKLNGARAEGTGWYAPEFMVFARTDASLDFGDKFLPVNTGLPEDPYYFAAHWRAIISAPAAGNYGYKVSSDDDSWVFIDGLLETDLGGQHGTKKKDKSLYLSAGLHLLDIYFAERHPTGSHFSFVPDERLKIHPRLDGCSILPYPNGGPGGGSGGNTGNNGGNGGVKVLGAEHARYTPASALLKADDAPDVYAVVNGHLHYISSPASFAEYGYRWEDVRTVSRSELSAIPRARLIKSPDSAAIYYLYQRPENKWFKIAIPSPTAFVSYPGNYWGNVVTVNAIDIAHYPDARLIKAAGRTEVYLLENNTKRSVPDEVFARLKFSRPEVVEVSAVHLDTYRTGEPL